MDCSQTEIYLKEKGRMTNTCYIDCAKCPLDHRNNLCYIGCEDIENEYPQKAIEIVQKWSDEHPQKTILDDFLEKFPNAALNSDGLPEDICCRYLGYKLSFKDCTISDAHVSCTDCWKQPFDGFVEESKK